MQDYKKLKVWQKAMTFTIGIYKATRFFPSEEKFGLISQIRRAAASICLNVAEGCGGNSRVDFAHFLQIGLKSTYEVKTALELAIRLELGKEKLNKALLTESDEICAMLHGLIRKLKTEN